MVKITKLNLAAAILILAVITCSLLIVVGSTLCVDKYFLSSNQPSFTSRDVWDTNSTGQVIVDFSLSSKAFITTNFEVTINAKITVLNETFNQILKSKGIFLLTVAGTYGSPEERDPLGNIWPADIEMKLDSSSAANSPTGYANTYVGTGNAVFPSLGRQYFYIATTRDTVEEVPTVWYTMNVSQNYIPPIFSIDEGYSARTSYEQQAQNTGLQIIAVGLTGLTIIGGMKVKQKKDISSIDKLRLELAETKRQLNKLKKTLKIKDQNG